MTATDHYEALLASVYDWMNGGWGTQAGAARSLFHEIGLAPSVVGERAVDLGAGTGYQTVALAGLGFRVLALDDSPSMLAELERRAETLPVATRRANLDELDGLGETLECLLPSGHGTT